MKKIIVSLVLGLGLVANVNAAGDADAGKAKTAMCSACHGATGLSPAEAYPNLAGQHADYLVKQLKAFKDGSRADAVMAPMAAGLSDADMADVAAFFSSQPRSAATGGDSASVTETAPAAPSMVADAAAGKFLYENGDESRSLAACVGCHGKDGNSDVLIYPNLAKQHPEYIAKQLAQFKDHARTDPAMNQFAGSLTEQEVMDLGAYLADPSAVESVKPKKAMKMAVATTFAGDVEAGKAAAATCAACHGADGNSMIPMYPKIAGQHEKYIAKQLSDFKKAVETSGKEGRVDPVMGGMVASLSADDIQNLSAFFASQQTSPSTATTNAAGAKLYLSGDVKRGITACVACHSLNGGGVASAGFPALVNQHSDYLKIQLEKFRSGERANDTNNMMGDIAVKLTDQEIADLSQYMSAIK